MTKVKGLPIYDTSTCKKFTLTDFSGATIAFDSKEDKEQFIDEYRNTLQKLRRL